MATAHNRSSCLALHVRDFWSLTFHHWENSYSELILPTNAAVPCVFKFLLFKKQLLGVKGLMVLYLPWIWCNCWLKRSHAKPFHYKHINLWNITIKIIIIIKKTYNWEYGARRGGKVTSPWNWENCPIKYIFQFSTYTMR